MYSSEPTRVRAYHGKGGGKGRGKGHDRRHDDVGDQERSAPMDGEYEAPPSRRAYHGKGYSHRAQQGEDHHQGRRAYHGKGRYGGKGKGKGRDDSSRYDPDYDRGESSRKKGGARQKVGLVAPLQEQLILLD